MKKLFLVLILLLIPFSMAYDEYKDNNDGTITKTVYSCLIGNSICVPTGSKTYNDTQTKEENIITADTIDATTIQAEYIYTKSKVPDSKGRFFNLFDSSIYNKLTHFAYRIVNGRGILDAEERWIGAEGYLACDRKCTLESKKWEEYQSCKIGC